MICKITTLHLENCIRYQYKEGALYAILTKNDEVQHLFFFFHKLAKIKIQVKFTSLIHVQLFRKTTTSHLRTAICNILAKQ